MFCAVAESTVQVDHSYLVPASSVVLPQHRYWEWLGVRSRVVDPVSLVEELQHLVQAFALVFDAKDQQDDAEPGGAEHLLLLH